MRRGAGLLLALAASGCAYYNSMWSAERYAKQARRAETRGEDGQARGLWQQAGVKAESVLVHHPRSRWADDALVLRIEAFVWGGDCAGAKTFLTRARDVSLDEGLRARADLAAAQCALDAGRTLLAGELLAAPLASGDAAVRSRASYLAGRLAWQRGDAPAAIAHYGRSSVPEAGPARVRALLAAGAIDSALAQHDALAQTPLSEQERLDLLAALAAVAGPVEASRALDRLVGRVKLPSNTRLRAQLADADRLLAAGLAEPALARYQAIAAEDLDGASGGSARMRMLRVAAQRAESLEALAAIRVAAGQAAATPGAGVAEAHALVALLESVVDPAPGEGHEFQAAEIARDSLHAAALAGRLFVGFAARHSASLFAPKAVVAALPLLPDRADSLLAVLRERYPTSPYTAALAGELSPSFAAAEDSLAQDLGVERARAMVAYRTFFAIPVPGRRGPWLEAIQPSLGDHAAVADSVRRPPVRRPADRPAQRPADRP